MEKKKLIVLSMTIFIVLIGLIVTKQFFSNKFNEIAETQQKILEILQKNENEQAENTNSPEDSTPYTNYELLQELGRLKKKIVTLEDQVDDHEDVLGYVYSTDSASMFSPELNDPTQIDDTTPNFVTISDKKWQKVDVFKEKNNSSAIIGQAVFGQAYSYLRNEDGYYFILLKDSVYGWIHGQFVKSY